MALLSHILMFQSRLSGILDFYPGGYLLSHGPLCVSIPPERDSGFLRQVLGPTGVYIHRPFQSRLSGILDFYGVAHAVGVGMGVLFQSRLSGILDFYIPPRRQLPTPRYRVSIPPERDSGFLLIGPVQGQGQGQGFQSRLSGILDFYGPMRRRLPDSWKW